jgi:hypothetical protein
MANANDPTNPRSESASEQVTALDNFLNGSSVDLGGVYLEPETIANALGARYKSMYRMRLTPKIIDTWKRMSDEEMAIRYHNFLRNNRDFPDIFKGDELRDMFTKPSRASRDDQGPIGAYIGVYQRMHSKNNSSIAKSAFNTQYEIPFLISLLNALFSPLPPAAEEHLRSVAAARAGSAAAAAGGGGGAQNEFSARQNGYVPLGRRGGTNTKRHYTSHHRPWEGGARRRRKMRRGRSRKSSRGRSRKTHYSS